MYKIWIMLAALGAALGWATLAPAIAQKAPAVTELPMVVLPTQTATELVPPVAPLPVVNVAPSSKPQDAVLPTVVAIPLVKFAPPPAPAPQMQAAAQALGAMARAYVDPASGQAGLPQPLEIPTDLPAPSQVLGKGWQKPQRLFRQANATPVVPTQPPNQIPGQPSSQPIDQPPGQPSPGVQPQMPPSTPPQPEAVLRTESGQASWYGYEAGYQTASGERYNARDYTAAHRTLPFGTRVRVTHARTGKSVVVRINNRGPFIRGRIIDLSVAAAEAVGIKSSGVGPVRVDVLSYGSGKRKKFRSR